MKGDENISTFERQLWSLHRHIVIRWGVYTMFSWRRMNALEGTPELVLWFVPDATDDLYEIRQYLEQELQGLVMPPVDLGYEDGSGKLPGREVKVMVMPFGEPIDWYADLKERRHIAGEAARHFLKTMGLETEKKDDGR